MKNKKWGTLAVINLYNCERALLKNEEHIKRFALDLCNHIDMKPYGPPLLKRFGTGELEGYSLIQFIETSSITIHLDEFRCRAFIDIFSCKDFDSKKASEYSQKYFKAKKAAITEIERR